VQWQVRREAAEPVRDDTARELVTEAGWAREAAMQVINIGSKAVIHNAVHADGTPPARYPQETRDEAVRQVLDKGLSSAEVAWRMELPAGIVRYWVRMWPARRAPTKPDRPPNRCCAPGVHTSRGVVVPV
jgi:hypothetical protein